MFWGRKKAKIEIDSEPIEKITLTKDNFFNLLVSDLRGSENDWSITVCCD